LTDDASDVMANSDRLLGGTKKWWSRKVLENFAVSYLSLPSGVAAAIFSRLAEAVTETRGVIPGYIAAHPEFREIGERMMAVWNECVSSLR
jgi:serine/threonine-protein kinase HipA